MVSIIRKYPYWQIRNYLQVPILSNKKLFASTPCLVHYPRGQGNKMANWKSCIGCWERFGVYISLGGVLTNTHFAIFAIIVLSTKKLLAYLLVMIVIRSNCYTVQNLSVRSRGVQSSHLRQRGENNCQNPSSTQYNLNCSWVLYENYFAPHPTTATQEHYTTTELGRLKGSVN